MIIPLLIYSALVNVNKLVETFDKIEEKNISFNYCGLMVELMDRSKNIFY